MLLDFVPDRGLDRREEPCSHGDPVSPHRQRRGELPARRRRPRSDHRDVEDLAGLQRRKMCVSGQWQERAVVAMSGLK